MTGEPGRADPALAGRLPDFIIGGAPRCGTTWLYRALDRHPGIHLAKPVRPEPKFFLVDAEYEKGLGYYSQRWFSDVPERIAAGEKSTNYLESRVAAERMAEALPGVKLVFLLREPASRAVSNYRFTKMHGLEDLDFAAALEAEGQRERDYDERLRFMRPFSYFSRGCYARHLARWFELFPRQQILVRAYEELVTAPGETLADVQRHLGVEARPQDAEGLGIVNGSDDAAVETSAVAALRHRYEEPNRDLRELLGDDLWAPEPELAGRG